MKINTIHIFTLLTFMLNCNSFADGVYTSSFNKDWLKCVVSMEMMASPSNSQSVGTGFILQSAKNHLILVTAKHVILDGNGNVNTLLGWRLNEKTNSSDLVADQTQTIITGSGWFISSNADVACRFVGVRNDSDFGSTPISYLLPQTNVQVGAHIVILGFPMGLRSETYTTPIMRNGYVARSSSEELMLDALVFPGNSGGPVLYEPTVRFYSPPGIPNAPLNDERIVGVVIDYIPYIDYAVSPQTHRPRVTFEENSGLSHAVPADKILELLSRPDFIKVDNEIHDWDVRDVTH